MANLNPQAEELNSTIEAVNSHVKQMLSTKGKNVFFPSKGILGQTAEAKGKRINATIGTALEDDGDPLCLSCISDMINVEAGEAFLYAPSFGKPELRNVWKNMMVRKNPTLVGKPISTPVITQALTHALSVCGFMFLNPGEDLILPELFWGNYKLLFQNWHGANLKTYNTFKDGGFDIDALKAALLDGEPGKRVVLLNFPNNPTGYTPTVDEVPRLKQVLVEAAEAGNDLVVLIDDAYFGLVYEDGIYKESIFGELADAHERLLAVKIDGATKEDYVWGFRVGFITYGIKGGDTGLYKALEAKTAGAIRGNISNAPALSQALLLKAFNQPEYTAQKKEKFETLKRRCVKVNEILDSHPEYADAFEALPFNSGYFMCVKLKNADPGTVRQILLDEYDTGLIAASGLIRIAFSSAPYDVLDDLFANLYQATLKAQQ